MSRLKIAFMGAGSTIFAKNVLGDILLTPAIQDCELALYDIDATRLKESAMLINAVNNNLNKNRALVQTYLGPAQRKEALKDASYVINAIQVGGYKPSTVHDFEIPKKYGLRQTIADTLGVGGVFRALRSIPVILDFARDMEEVCPEAWLLNYTNPMSMITGAVLRSSSIRTIGLCHSVQICVPNLLRDLSLDNIKPEETNWKIAGINHMAWLLSLEHKGQDLYPRVKELAAKKNQAALADPEKKHNDMIRYEIMAKFGYYITESSEHNAEYTPFWIKDKYPELIDRYKIPLDEYPRRCVEQINDWAKRREEIMGDMSKMTHEKSYEYASYIIEAMQENKAYRLNGNVLNQGHISNLPNKLPVEIPCLVDANGVQGLHVGALPVQCAALNRTNMNVHELAIEAALTRSRDHIYHALFLDPHTAGELSMDDIIKMTDELIEAHGTILPKFK